MTEAGAYAWVCRSALQGTKKKLCLVCGWQGVPSYSFLRVSQSGPQDGQLWALGSRFHGTREDKGC